MKRHWELIKCNELKMYSNCTRCVNETLILQFREKLEPLMKVWLGNFLLGQKSIGQKSFCIFPLHVNPNNLDASRLFVVFLLRKLHSQLQFKPTWYSDRRITGFVATEFFFAKLSQAELALILLKPFTQNHNIYRQPGTELCQAMHILGIV